MAVVRILWIFFAGIEPVSDSAWYYEKGLSIASGSGYTIIGIPTAYYPAGYPIFLGLVFMVVGNSLFAAAVMKVLLSCGILYFSYYASKVIFDSDLTGRISLLLLAVYPNLIAYSSILATEILFLFLLLSGYYPILRFNSRFRILIAAGILWGFMTLVKPQGLFIFAPLIIFTYYREKEFLSRKLKSLFIVYPLMIITILPWMYRNYNVFNDFLISTNEGINLLIGNNPYAIGQYNLGDSTLMYLWDKDN